MVELPAGTHAGRASVMQLSDHFSSYTYITPIKLTTGLWWCLAWVCQWLPIWESW